MSKNNRTRPALRAVSDGRPLLIAVVKSVLFITIVLVKSVLLIAVVRISIIHLLRPVLSARISSPRRMERKLSLLLI